MYQFLKNNVLFVALAVGAIFYKTISVASFISPSILFLILFITFSKLNIKELKFEKIHFIMLAYQIITSIILYYSLASWNQIVAQGLLIAILCPTAVSAAVATSKMGGRIESITTYTMFSNLTIAILIPILFPFISDTAEGNFIQLFSQIATKIGPLLIGPFVLAQLLKYTLPKINAKISSVSGISFYFWAVALTILTAQTVKSLIETENAGDTIIWLTITSLMACAANFALGRILGKKMGHPIAATQSLGQKNTILAIWVSHTFLNPLSAIAPGCYVIWQNLFNAWQIYQKTKGHKSN